MTTEQADGCGPPRTDEFLAATARSGDHDAFRELVERYHGLVFAYAMARLCDRESAEDIVQDAFVSAYQALDRFRPSACWSAWLMRIVRNACTDAMRRRRVRGTIALAADVADGTPGPLERLLTDERRTELMGAVAGLPEKYRTPLRMHYGSEMKYREIAIALAIPESTVVGRMAGALRLLRRRLDMERT